MLFAPVVWMHEELGSDVQISSSVGPSRPVAHELSAALPPEPGLAES
jgi:hypothetical protein